MTLSVIIVNYNVKYFLEQCLISVLRAVKDTNAEVWVVDNASADGSCQMVKERFPHVKLIENHSNVGFSVANNQAIRQSKGKYVLLLNPDTVVQEDTFTKCIAFMDSHPEAGSLTVKMIDGKGVFLPESKRALPSPIVSFYKIFGLSRLFPHSRTFARYHLGHLDPNQTHSIEILPGAYMFMRKEALDKTGLLDETFFMYGEDIDLSYRILKEGYKNYYYPETTIIHYKGESTKKGSINYVLIFYKAMAIFAQKHFSKKNARLYILIIYLAIYFRALASIVSRVAKRLALPLADTALISAGITFLVSFWEQYRFGTSQAYPNQLLWVMIPAYITTWLLSLYLSGAYDKPQKLFAASKGVAYGALAILAAYALLPVTMRFSRALILISTAWALVSVQGLRFAWAMAKPNTFPSLRRTKRVAIVGTPPESDRVTALISNAGADVTFLGNIAPSNTITHKSQIATLDQISEFIRINRIDEVVFCSNDLSLQEIIRHMLLLTPTGIEFKIAPQDSLSVIGSNSINSPGELYTLDFKAISEPANRRRKRIFDVAAAALLLIAAPILWLTRKPGTPTAKQSLSVLFGRKTWIGYIQSNSTSDHLPRIKPSVFAFATITHTSKEKSNTINHANLIYAKSYSVTTDLMALYKRVKEGIE
ncbi:MAG: glycosyltransferase [Bacteroidales bacterium]|nr:glycosyltransferase [Bacteroidales bacterium]MBN2750009.1 glycosyltransferase [Bacteroidales bacterium]